MSRKNFNSKYAADPSEITPENEVHGMEGAGIFIPPREFLSDEDLGGKIDRPQFSQLQTTRRNKLDRKRIVYKRPDRNISEEERQENVTVDPFRFEDYLKEQVERPLRNPVSKAKEAIRAQNVSDRHELRAAVIAIHDTLRNAYPCDDCGGQKNGGKPLMPINRRNEQEYCSCDNKGYKLTKPCPDCLGDGDGNGNGCGSDGCDKGNVRVSEYEHFFDLHKKARIQNMMFLHHEKYCTHKACSRNCPINRTQVQCTGCSGKGEDKNGVACRRCNKKGTVGAVDDLRADFYANEQAKRDAATSDNPYTPQEISKKETHARSGSSERTIRLVGPRAVSGRYEDIAPQFQGGSVYDKDLSFGDPVWVGGYDTANPDSGIRKGESQEQFKTYSEGRPQGVDELTGERTDLIDSRMRQELIRGESGSDTEQHATAPSNDNAYEDHQSFGAVTARSIDGRKVDIVSSGRPIEGLRAAREQVRKHRGPEARIVRTETGAIDNTRVPGINTEFRNYRNDEPGRTTREAAAEQINNIFNEVAVPKLGELPHTNTKAGRHKFGKTLRSYPAERAVKISDATAPLFCYAGESVERVPRRQIFPSVVHDKCQGAGCTGCGRTGVVGGGTTEIPVVTGHISDHGLGVRGYRKITSQTIDPEARQERERRGKELDIRAGIEPGSPMSLVDLSFGSEAVPAAEKAREVGRAKPMSISDKENQAVFSMPTPKLNVPMPEIPGELLETDSGKGDALDTAERTVGRKLTDEEKSKFFEGLTGGHINRGLEAIGENTGENNEQ